jgi:hypothetical protein
MTDTALAGDTTTPAPAATTPTSAAPAAATSSQQTPATTAPAATAAPTGAPEAYTDFSLPQGVSLQPDFLDDVKAMAKGMNLPQAEAQKIVDIGAKYAAQANEAIARQVSEWGDAAKSDKEIGGDKWDSSLQTAKTALSELGTPALKELLNKTGLGNHPDVIRFFVNAGKLVSQGRVVQGDGKGQPSGPGMNALASKLYPTQ